MSLKALLYFPIVAAVVNVPILAVSRSAQAWRANNIHEYETTKRYQYFPSRWRSRGVLLQSNYRKNGNKREGRRMGPSMCREIR